MVRRHMMRAALLALVPLFAAGCQNGRIAQQGKQPVRAGHTGTGQQVNFGGFYYFDETKTVPKIKVTIWYASTSSSATENTCPCANHHSAVVKFPGKTDVKRVKLDVYASDGVSIMHTVEAHGSAAEGYIARGLGVTLATATEIVAERNR